VDLNQLMQKLSLKGYKLTPQRRLILEILNRERHLSADEIFDRVKKSQPNVSFGTVYRNLNILTELGLINQLDFKDGRYRFEIHKAHHHHLVCLDCGIAIEMEVCPLSQLVGEIADSNNFKVKCHNFEVFGYCSKCQKSKGSNS